MTRTFAQAVLCNPDIVCSILGPIYEQSRRKEKKLAKLVRVNKAFYTAGIPLLYRSIELCRSYPPEPSTSYAIRLRCLQEDTSLGRHVRSLDATSVTVEQLDKLLAHLPFLTYLRWEPLSLQRGILHQLPRLPESLDSLEIASPSPEDAIYRYDPHALSAMVSPLRNLTHLTAQDFTLPELLTVIQVIGERLETLFIDRTGSLKASAEDEKCWPLIFDCLPVLRSLVICAMCPSSALAQLPPSVERLMLQGLDPSTLLDVTRMLKSPAWLPNLKSLPCLVSIPWTAQAAEIFGPDYVEALPSKVEVLVLAKDAMTAYRKRPLVLENGFTKEEARVFRDQVRAAIEEPIVWHVPIPQGGEGEESESSEDAWEE